LKLHRLLSEDLVLPDLAARDRAGVIGEMSAALEARRGDVAGAGLLDKLMKREELGSTAVGRGVAVPHCRAKGLGSPAVLLGLSRRGVAFEAADGKPAHVFFLLVSPEENPATGLRLLAAIAALTRTSRTLASRLLKALSPADVLRTLKEEEDKSRD
jgi:PTS system nitrogen regulatory IIA component